MRAGRATSHVPAIALFDASALRAAVAAAALGAALTGCVLPGSGMLAPAETPRPLPQGCAPLAVAYTVSFLPPVEEVAKAALTREFTAELEAAGLFGSHVPAPATARLQIAVELTQTAAAPGTFVLWYWLTATLIPLRVPFVYELRADVRVDQEQAWRYELSDRASTWVWSPGYPAGASGIVADVTGMDPTSPSVRRNLYRTLWWRIGEDLRSALCASDVRDSRARTPVAEPANGTGPPE